MSFIGDWFRIAVDRASSGEFGYTVTLESVKDEGVWIQLSWDRINAAYPFQVAPAQLFESLALSLPPLAEVSEWAPQQFVTIEHGAEPLDDLVVFVESYLAKALGSPAEQVNFRASESR